ncbi:MAG: dienelactone hydrolase family protein [Pseudomonadota bacterium]
MAVTTSSISIAVEGGDMNAFLAVPDGGRGKPIVMLQEIFGVNDAMKAKAEMFAAQGFVVLAPDLFWRLEPGVDLGYDDESRKKAFGHMQAFDFPAGLRDIKAAFKALAGRPEAEGAPAYVGYCLGGKLAVVAGAMTEGVAAVVSFYGVKLDENIEQMQSMTCPLVLHFGTNDSHIPVEVSSQINDALADSSHAAVYIYDGAQHGFFNKVREDVYDASASAHAMERTLQALRSS